ncbi:hypothetical protein [Campylobacter armoricus]|uniref:hypothetical protein n=1 Tax=Campylobacter armoricus TaxID=2505970 RepID=UPI0011160608|nr:hypothetical protein [Campylobacter armoricus]
MKFNNINIFYTDNVGTTQISNESLSGITAKKVTDLNAEKAKFAGFGNIKYDKAKDLFYLTNGADHIDKGHTEIEKPTNAGAVADIEVSDDMWDKTTIQNIINELIDNKYEIVLTDLDKIKINEQEYLLSDMNKTDNPFYQSFTFLQAFADNTRGSLNALLTKYSSNKDFKHYQEASNYVKNGKDSFNAKIQELKDEKVDEYLNKIKDDILALESVFSKWNIKITDLIANYNSLLNAFIADKKLYDEKRKEFEELITTEGFDKLEAEKLKKELLAMDKKLVSDYENLSDKRRNIENMIKLANAELDLDNMFSNLNKINDKIKSIVGGEINTEMAFNINKPSGEKAQGSIKYNDNNILADANFDLDKIKNDSGEWSGGNMELPEKPDISLPETPTDSTDNSNNSNENLNNSNSFNQNDDDEGENKKKLKTTLYKEHSEEEKTKVCITSNSSLTNNICLQ